MRLPSHGTVAAYTALFIALGGTAYAAVGPNSVGSREIKRGGVAGSDIRANAVTSAKVKNGALRAVDFGAGELPAGTTGPHGPKGDKGDKGADGTNGTNGSDGANPAVTTVFFQATSDLANGANANYGAFCPAGKQAIAGGGRGDAQLSEETILTNTRPAISSANTEPPLAGQGFAGWRITVFNPTGGAATGIRPEVWAVCVPAP
jgi:hypothetical protein